MNFVDLETQFELLEKDIRTAINTVLNHGKFIMGPEVFELEKQLAKYVGVKHAISCSSGTDALLMPLMAQKIGPGDAVFTSPFTFIATAEVISLLGATPVFVDIDPATLNIDPQKLLLAIEAIKKNDPSIHPLPKYPVQCNSLIPKAIIPVDIFGLPADYDTIMDIAQRENLFVLEDAAQSFGSEYKGRKTGGLGHAGATSFFPAKPLGCYGDGGAVFTNDDTLADHIRSLRSHGKGAEKYDNTRIGLNARLDTLQAAILLPKLQNFPWEIKCRQEIAASYIKQLTHLSSKLRFQKIPKCCSSVWAQFSLLVSDRNALQEALKEKNIPTMVYYTKGLTRQAAYKDLAYKDTDFPVTTYASEKILNLPIHPYMTQDQIDLICTTINNFYL